jgi:diguanylate cyclase (GGDEF)-like protein
LATPDGPGSWVIGCGEDVDVRIDDRSVSRRHALLHVRTGAVRPEVTLEDLGSTNGCAVERERVTGTQVLRDRDRVVLGDVELVFRLLLPMEIHRRRQLVADAREAVRDPLTGCRTRRFLTRGLPRLMRTHRQTGLALAMAIFDIDHFKQINDAHGHQAGDRVLRAVAEKLRDSLRTVDFVVRYGGEEFVAILPDTNLTEAGIAAERVRARIAEFEPADIVPGLRVTISGGFAVLSPGETVDAWFERADVALYRAKRGGRDQVLAAAEAESRS